MKVHTSNFKNEIKLLGKEIDSKITFGSTVLGKDDLNSVTPSFQGSILKSVMKELDIDSNIDIPLNTVLKYEFGVKVNGEYEYINFGNYVVYKSEKQEDTNSYRITCYDKMLYSMKEYEKMNITYPITLRNYINAVCSHLGLTFKDNSGTFVNYNRTIQNELYIDKDGNSLGYTFRDVFDELAQATASTICINNNDELEIRYINDTGDTIDEEFLRDVNVNFGEKFGAVNTIVLSRSAESDNVYYPETLPANPYELKIVDNQIMNGNDRADYLPDIYNKLNGLEFYINDFSSTGICYYDLCDRYNVKVGDKTYSCVMFNDEILVTQGLRENVFTDMPKETKTDYTKADKTDRRINQTNLIVDKQNQEIQALVESVKDIEVDTTLTKQASGNPITIEDAGAYPCENLIVEGKNEQETRSGNNILEFDNAISTASGVDVEKKNGVLTLSGTSSSSGAVDLGTYTLPAGTYYQHSNGSSGASTYSLIRSIVNGTVIKAGNGKITLTETTNVKFDIFFNEKFTGTYTYKPMVNEGSSALSWEQGGVSPSPDYPSEIETVKGIENLFSSDLELGAFSTSGVPADNSNCVRTKDFISIKPSTTYTLSNNNHYQNLLYFYDVNENFISTTNSLYDITFTTPENAYFLKARSSYGNVQNDLSTLYTLVEGRITHPYVPYGSRYLINKITGKNMLDISYAIAKYSIDASTGLNVAHNGNGCGNNYIKVKPNTTYTISCNASVFNLRISEYDINKNNIQRVTGTNVSSHTFTTTPTTNYVRWSLNIDNTDVTLDKLKVLNLMLRLGTDTDYELYKEKIITYDLKKENLFSSSLELGTINTSTGVNEKNNNCIRSADYIEVKPNTIYTLSNNNNYQNLVYFYDTNKNFISVINSLYDITFTTPENAYFIKIRSSMGSVQNDLTTIYKLYEGTGSEDYYELADKDKLDEATGVLTKRIAKVVLDGVNNKFLSKHSTIYTDTNGFYGFQLPNKILGKNGDTNHAICTHLTYIAERYASQSVNTTGLWWEGSVATNYASIPFLTLNDANQWLVDEYNKGTPVTIYYILAEEETIQLEPTEIELFKGTNNIYTLDDLEPNMNITYLTDTKLNAQYATKSELKVAEGRIESEINATLENEYATIEQTNAIEQKITDTENSIMLKVNQKANTTDVNKAIDKLTETTEASLELKLDKTDNNQVVAMINASADEVNIDGKKIALANFEITDEKLMSDIIPEYDFVYEDLTKLQYYLIDPNANPLTDEEKIKYDANKDGVLDIYDLVVMQQAIMSGISKTNPGKFEIDTSPDTTEILKFYNSQNQLVYYIGYMVNKLNVLYCNSLNVESLTAGNIDSGICTLNSTNIVTVNFNKTFETVPNVVITPYTTTTGVIAPKINEITNTGFKATIGGSGISNVQCCWIAIG